MVKLGEQLENQEMQGERLTRTQRVAKQQLNLRNLQEAKRQARIKKEVEDFGDQANYENYEEKYSKLSSDAQQRVLSPSELKKTEGYDKYSKEKAEYEKQLNAYNEAQAYNYDLEVATKFFRKGLGGYMLGNKRQKEIYRQLKDNQYLYQQKLLHPEQYSTDLKVYQKNPELKEAVIKGQVTPIISTDYGNTKVEWQQNIPTKEEQYEEWEKQQDPLDAIENVEKKTTIVDRGISKVKDFFTGWSLDVTGTSYPKLTISRKRDGDAGQELATSFVKYGYETAKTGYEKIPTSQIYVKQTFGKTIFSPTINTGLTLSPKGNIKLSDVKQKSIEDLEKIKSDAYEKDLARIGIEDIEKKAQDEYQARFENQYMKDLIYENIDFETASKEFEESDTAKQIQKNYENTVQNELMDLGFTKSGWTQAGVGMGEGVLKLVPTDTKTAGVTLIGGSLGYSALKSIPTSVALIGTGGIGTWGGYKALSPTSTPTERAGGVITAGISALTLGYAGYKYLRKPVIKTEKIKVPVKEIKNKKALGIKDPTKQVVKLGGKRYTIDTTYFGKQKLSRQVIDGRRTIVTSNFKSLLKKVGIKTKPIYEGIPTQQLGKVYQVEGLRGSYIIKGKSAYQKALKRLTNYGYSSSQAKEVLRFRSPRVINLDLEKGIIRTVNVNGVTSATGKLKTLTEQPKILANKELGIYTRSAKPKIDYYEFDRYPMTSVKGNTVFKTDILKTSPYKNIGKTTTRFEELSIVKDGEIRKGLMRVGEGEGFNVLEKVKFQDLKSQFVQRQTLPLKRKVFFGESETRIIQPQRIGVVEYDIDKYLGISKSSALTPANIKKTPFSKTFGATKEIKKIISSKKPASVKDIQKIVNKIETSSTASSSSSVSKYYGKGQYERTIGGILPKQTGVTELTQLPLPPPQQFGLKDVILIKQNNLLLSQLGLTSSLGSRFNLKNKQLSKSNLKLDNNIKGLINEKINFDVKEDVMLKDLTATKSLSPLKSKLRSAVKDPTPIDLSTPRIRQPEITSTPASPKAIPLFFLKGKISKKMDKKRKKFNELAYLPDFTSRAIGLDPEILTQQQAKKKINKLLTGLEIRRPIKIKNVF